MTASHSGDGRVTSQSGTVGARSVTAVGRGGRRRVMSRRLVDRRRSAETGTVDDGARRERNVQTQTNFVCLLLSGWGENYSQKDVGGCITDEKTELMKCYRRDDTPLVHQNVFMNCNIDHTKNRSKLCNRIIYEKDDS